MRWAVRDAGVTLIELAAVLAIFSVLSLMGVQLLSQGVANRDTLARSDARIAALTGAVAVLRRDLEHALPHADAAGEEPVFAISDDGLTLAVATGDSPVTVTWSVVPGEARLSRQLLGSGAETISLAEVEAMRVEVFDAGGWTDGAGWRPEGPADMPRGVRVVLSLGDLADVPVLVAR